MLSILESNISGYSRVLRVTLGEVMGGAGDMGQYTTLTYVHYPARKYLFCLYFYVAITYQIKPHEASPRPPRTSTFLHLTQISQE